MVDVNVSVGHRCHGYVYIWLYVDMQISRDLDERSVYIEALLR